MMVELYDTMVTSGNSIFVVFQFLFIFLIIALVGWYIWMYFFQYNIKFRVREVLEGNTRIIDDKARHVKDSEGVLKYKLFKRKHIVQLPPQAALHLTDKGKYSLEAYYLPEGEYKYVLDEGCNPDKLKNFRPIDTSDREFYASEMREAETYKKKSWKDHIPLLVGVGTPLIVLILVFAFWGDITEPIIQVGNQQARVSEDLSETSKLLRDVVQDRQEIGIIDKELRDDSKKLEEG